MSDFEDSIYPELRRIRARHPLWPGPMQRGWIAAENRLAEQDEKKNFAEALSNALAKKIASGLRQDLPNILPDEHGHGLLSRTRCAKGYKQLDVNYSTPQLGLGLGIAVETLNFRDKPAAERASKLSRYTNFPASPANDARKHETTTSDSPMPYSRHSSSCQSMRLMTGTTKP